jgi:hypothetical protein
MESFFRNHLELMFMKFDFNLITNTLNMLVMGVSDEDIF